MNQFESDTLRFALVFFGIFCISFCFHQFRLWLWDSLPRLAMLCSLAWLISSVIVIGGIRFPFLQGFIFAIAYFVVVLISAPLLAVGIVEVILGLYATLSAAKHKERFSGKPHFAAALATFTCLGVYCVLGAIRSKC